MNAPDDILINNDDKKCHMNDDETTRQRYLPTDSRGVEIDNTPQLNKTRARWRKAQRKRRQPEKDAKLLVKIAEFSNRNAKKNAPMSNKFSGLAPQISEFIQSAEYGRWFASLSFAERKKIVDAMLSHVYFDEARMLVASVGRQHTQINEAIKSGDEYFSYTHKRYEKLGLKKYRITRGEIDRALANLRISGKTWLKKLQRCSDAKLKKAILREHDETRKNEEQFAKLIAYCLFGKTRKYLLQIASLAHHRASKMEKTYAAKYAKRLRSKGVLDKQGNLTELGQQVVAKL